MCHEVTEKKMYMYTMYSISPYPLFSFLLSSASYPGFFISILLCFIYFPISKVAKRLSTEQALLSGVLCVFIHHPPLPPPQGSSEAIGSIRPGGLFFIVIHPADYTLLMSHCILSACCHCEKQMPFLKKKVIWKMRKE